MLRRVPAHPNRLVVTIDMAQADRASGRGAQDRRGEALQVARVERVESARRKVDEVVGVQVDACVAERAIEAGELANAVVAADQGPGAVA